MFYSLPLASTRYLRPPNPLYPRQRTEECARASVDDSCPRSPPSTFLGPKSPCGGDAWAGGGIREALYKSPGYRLTRAHSFSSLLTLSPFRLPSSLSLFFHVFSLILYSFFFFFYPSSRFFFIFYSSFSSFLPFFLSFYFSLPLFLSFTIEKL